VGVTGLHVGWVDTDMATQWAGDAPRSAPAPTAAGARERPSIVPPAGERPTAFREMPECPVRDLVDQPASVFPQIRGLAAQTS
jgi:hypothetical protein